MEPPLPRPQSAEYDFGRCDSDRTITSWWHRVDGRRLVGTRTFGDRILKRIALTADPGKPRWIWSLDHGNAILSLCSNTSNIHKHAALHTVKTPNSLFAFYPSLPS